MNKVRIELQNISKSYYSETAVTQALRKISLSFAMGEFVAITGESGSGKSTLLNIIGGMDTFDEGEMIVDGEATFQYDDEDWENYRRTKIGYVFQDYSLIGHYTALDNVISALLIMGQTTEEAKEISLRYLQQVGLDGYETHRASELSSGQKQRLSIARALAKDTGIIVADEPTGNLDSETGDQIIQLLKELSKDRLVIVVTHNYDQMEAYVTRRVRLHDGQIISDVAINDTAGDQPTVDAPEVPLSEDTTPETPLQENQPVMSSENNKTRLQKILDQNHVASIFARRNRKTQVGRATLFTAFLFVIAVASFLFIGELFIHKEDTFTRKYTKAAFYHEDPTRLSVKRQDGKDLSSEDIEILSSVRYVRAADSCDLANDINYYLDEDKDYEYKYGDASKRSFRSTGRELKIVSFMNENRFMMSTDAISEDDLAYGRLPQARNEVVLYAADDKLLDTSKECFFAFHNIWDPEDYYKINVTIVGILKEPTEQVYFTRELCQMLSLPLSENSELRLIEGKYKFLFTPVISDNLSGNEARLSLDATPEIMSLDIELKCLIQRYDDAGNPVGDPEVDALTVHNNSSGTDAMNPIDYKGSLIEVSEGFFNQHYKLKSAQASVYIENYAKMDTVLNKLKKLGYDAISTYRISTMDYDEELVTQRLTVIGICALGLVILLLAEVLILRSLMKIRIKDYFVLKFIGMKLQLIRRISYFEMLAYTAIAVFGTILIMWLLRLFPIPIIKEIIWYYDISAYLLFILYNFLLILLTVLFFNRLLKGRLNA